MIAGILNLWTRWGGKVILSIADQGVTSGASFVLSILLARWLSPAEYGGYAVAFSVFLFLFGFYSALILEPMSVLGPARHNEHLSKYLGDLVWIHTGLAVGLALVLAATALVLGMMDSTLEAPFLGLALAMPFVLLFWLLRRACYLKTRPNLALKGSLLYAVFLLLGLLIVQMADRVSSLNAYILTGMASIGASLVLWRSLDVGAKEASRVMASSGIRIVWAEQWAYGRWIVAASFAHGLSNTLYLPLIGGFVGLAQAGAFRAMQSLVLPLQEALIALGLLLLPWISGQRAVQGEDYLKRTASRVILMNVSLASSYALFLVALGQRVVKVLYGHERYGGFLWLLPFFVGAALIAAIGQSLSIILRAMERPDAILWSKLGAAVSALGCFTLVWKWGLYGAMFGLLLNALAETLVLLYCVKEKKR